MKLQTTTQANGKPVRIIDGPLMPLRSRSFQIGYADAKYGIETFPDGGTDRFPTLADFKAGILKACELCQDKDYAAGSRAAFADLVP